jgi:hypothetical protein
MKKNLRVLQIKGFRGLFITFFIISCLIAGFIAFPSFVLMSAWNYLADKITSLHIINFWGGLLLWGIIICIMLIFNKKRFIVSFNTQKELNEDEMKEIISKIQSQTMNRSVLLPKNYNNQNEKKEEPEEISSTDKEV